jgi:fluoride ion exporter CrcB/FEX
VGHARRERHRRVRHRRPGRGARRPLARSRHLRPLLGTGVLGGYTTFSTLSVEADVLVKDGRAGVAVAYVVAPLVVGLGAVVLGTPVGRHA